PAVYLAPSAYEAGFVSAEHSEADIETTIAAADAAFRSMLYSRAFRIRAGHTRKSVAKPRKIKNPPLSVIAVIMTEEPSAGSRPKRIMVSGISTPAVAERARFSVIAAVITRPSDTF